MGESPGPDVCFAFTLGFGWHCDVVVVVMVVVVDDQTKVNSRRGWEREDPTRLRHLAFSIRRQHWHLLVPYLPTRYCISANPSIYILETPQYLLTTSYMISIALKKSIEQVLDALLLPRSQHCRSFLSCLPRFPFSPQTLVAETLDGLSFLLARQILEFYLL